MKRITALQPEQVVKIDKSVGFNSSWIEFEDDVPDINIGYGVKLSSAQITVCSGGKLVIKDLCEISGRIIVGPGCQVTIGYGLICNDLIYIQSADNANVTIGDDCLFANTRIYSSDMHSIFLDETGERINKSQDIVIEDKVWLSRDVLILKGTEIGKNSIVGARSVLAGKYSGSSMITGSPGKVVKTGISWSRTLVDQKSKILTPDFSIYKFRSAAVQFNNCEVIAQALHLWDVRDTISNEDCYVLYYLARAILLRDFKGKNIDHVIINDRVIRLEEIHNILTVVFEKSNGRNEACKGYADLADEMLAHLQSLKRISSNEKYAKVRSEYKNKKRYNRSKNRWHST
ncbi:TPA: hypothetical protein ACJIK4_001497 [Kluyvera cryocrescens]